MTRIIIMRHGETEWNRQDVFRGTIDVPLNEAGVEQARKAALALKDENISAAYSSPLRRAMQTAGAVAAAHGITTRAHPGFNDCHFGQWQGVAKAEVKVRFREVFDAWAVNPENARIPDGEDFAAVRQRAVKALDETVAENPGKTVLVVTHRVITKILLCAALGLDGSYFWSINQDNCCINIVSLQSPRSGTTVRPARYIVELVNDTCHLRPGAGGVRPLDTGVL
jgi:broad specificity phosphatase PhoE